MKKILLTLLSASAALMVSAGNKNNLRYVGPYIRACMPFTGEVCTYHGEQVSSYFYALTLDNGIHADNDAGLATGIRMKIYADRSGFQFCAGQGMNGKEIGKRGNRYNFRSGVAFKTQNFPDAPS